MRILQFPKHFLWGAATSAHQVEGGNHNDWSEWEKRNATRLARESERAFAWNPHWKRFKREATDPRNYISGLACDHYYRFRDDFDLARELNHNAHRFSIEWSRIEPEEGRFDERAIAHYREVVQALRERGLEPFVTLWHWTLPPWVAERGGVLAPDFPRLFRRYAERMAQECGPAVRFWITLNEPDVYAGHAYLKGQWPPMKKGVFNYLKAVRALAETHRRAYAAIRQADETASIGIAKHQIAFEVARPTLWNRLLKYLADRVWNRDFLDRIRDHQDFIGLNHYNRNVIDGWYGQNPNVERTDFGWEYAPDSLYQAIMELRRYRKPVYVTENGLADASDALRSRFLPEALSAVHRAVEDGADVRGYLYWSLLDNFEWDKGYWPRFGLVVVDYPTQERTVRESARWYAEVCRTNRMEAPESRAEFV